MKRAGNPGAAAPRFCSQCGGRLNAEARFCQDCGSPVHGGVAHAEPGRAAPSSAWRWAVPLVALAALAVLSAVRMSSSPAAGPAAAPLGMGGGAGGAPDISSMSPAERADRLFNRVMMLSSEGKVDSARFFAPMAAAAIQALAPLDAHRRYDLGLVGLAAGDLTMAAGQADSILAGHATHLLGLALAARVAEARGNVAESRRYREALIAAEPSERARGLQEYTDHDTDLRAVIGSVPAR